MLPPWTNTPARRCSALIVLQDVTGRKHHDPGSPIESAEVPLEGVIVRENEDPLEVVVIAQVVKQFVVIVEENVDADSVEAYRDALDRVSFHAAAEEDSDIATFDDATLDQPSSPMTQIPVVKPPELLSHSPAAGLSECASSFTLSETKSPTGKQPP